MFVCVFQSPTARRCGWWCLWCACRWLLSPSSSLSSSAPWDITEACRAPKVRDGFTQASARQSIRCHCSFHNIVTNLSLRQLCKRRGADLRRVFAEIMQSVLLFFLTAHESKQSLHTHSLYFFNETNTDSAVAADFDVFTALVSSSSILNLYWLLLFAATFILNNHVEMLFYYFLINWHEWYYTELQWQEGFFITNHCKLWGTATSEVVH